LSSSTPEPVASHRYSKSPSPTVPRSSAIVVDPHILDSMTQSDAEDEKKKRGDDRKRKKRAERRYTMRFDSPQSFTDGEKERLEKLEIIHSDLDLKQKDEMESTTSDR